MKQLFKIFRHFIGKEKRLIILDNIFPHLLSAFRIAEFNFYLENIYNCKVYSTSTAFSSLNETRSLKEVKKEYTKLYPALGSKIVHYTDQRLKSKIIYTVFLDNAYNFLRHIEKYKIPFIFTLYPGGGFQLHQIESDNKLKKLFKSLYFLKVIVTSKVTFDYLVSKNLCDKNQIEFIYGVVSASDIFTNNNVTKKKIPTEKVTFDVCFVAYKYTSQGKDKGYDIFVRVAKILAKIGNNIHFHVVGNFDKDDYDITEIANNIKFYNSLKTNSFADFYSSMDIILSPNSSFVLAPGGFDGFPTGACIEAGLNGVALFVCDDLNQNFLFKDGEDIEIITKDPIEIADKIFYYYTNPLELYSLSAKGKSKIQEHYNLEAQMIPRMNLINKMLSQS